MIFLKVMMCRTTRGTSSLLELLKYLVKISGLAGKNVDQMQLPMAVESQNLLHISQFI
jgi:hypothetical protein